MITKYALLAAVSLTSTVMAIDSQDSHNQNQIVRLYDTGMTTEDDILYGHPEADQTVLISQADIQQYTGVTTEFKLFPETYVPALSAEQRLAITELNLSGAISETKKNKMQAILQNVVFDNSSFPPPNFQLFNEPNHDSFFSRSWGSSCESNMSIFTQKKNMALYLVPMAMFVLGHINAQK